MSAHRIANPGDLAGRRRSGTTMRPTYFDAVPHYVEVMDLRSPADRRPS
jgi:hypothetical protein